ncbi:MGDG synthase family glycosyltransferase [Gordonia jacobaea]|uniref:MGDG synthase family glycosyltransferase n=1 Tax=Gordonia jacobaea TaxID=122202 RepID=UPI0022E231D0|nr:glycosyltransferase [Gordonia jacobaea]
MEGVLREMGDVATAERHVREVLVLYMPFGGGHKAAAEALARELTASEHLAARALDISEHLFSRLKLSRTLRRIYDVAASSFGGRIHGAIYRFADSHPDLVVHLVEMFLGREFDNYISRMNPIAIVSTFPIIASSVSRRSKLSMIPAVSVITDAGRVNKIWAVPSPVLTLTGDIDTRSILDMEGVDTENFVYSGPIVSTALSQAPSRSTARRILDIDQARFTVFLNCGLVPSRRAIRQFINLLQDRGLAVQILVRKDVKLGRVDEQTVVRVSPSLLQVVGIAAADLVVGKAGWATLNEAIALEKPVIIIDRIPGQEDGNVAYALKHKGAAEMSPQEAVIYVESFIKDSSTQLSPLSLWSDAAVRAATTGVKNAAEKISKVIEQSQGVR